MFITVRTLPRPARPPRGTEKHVEAAIVQAFWFRHRIKLWKIDAGGAGFRAALRAGSSGHSGIPPGFPDLLGLIPPQGRGLFIEVKRPGDKPRKHQADFLAGLAATGAVAFWADSVDSALAQFEEAR